MIVDCAMSLDHMPELTWTFGYPPVLVVMVAICAVVYRYFKRVGRLE